MKLARALGLPAPKVLHAYFPDEMTPDLFEPGVGVFEIDADLGHVRFQRVKRPDTVIAKTFSRDDAELQAWRSIKQVPAKTPLARGDAVAGMGTGSAAITIWISQGDDPLSSSGANWASFGFDEDGRLREFERWDQRPVAVATGRELSRIATVFFTRFDHIGDVRLTEAGPPSKRVAIWKALRRGRHCPCGGCKPMGKEPCAISFETGAWVESATGKPSSECSRADPGPRRRVSAKWIERRGWLDPLAADDPYADF